MIHRYTTERIRSSWQRVRHFVFHNLLHADDPPHRLAMGVAVGMFVAFTPTMGVQMLLNVFLAWLLRANKVVGVPLVWISNPATMVPVYWFCYFVGRIVLGHEGIDGQWWTELAHPPAGWLNMVSFYWSRFMQIAAPLWLGSCLVGLAAGAASYYVVYYVVRWYRLRRWGQLVPPMSDEYEPRPSQRENAA